MSSETSFYLIPSYFDDVVSRLSRKNWLVHSFNLSEEKDLYNPAHYLHNSEKDGTQYVLYLDLNIYQFLINIEKKKGTKNVFRDAASLLFFCQTADIDIDPTFSVYEKINYNVKNLPEALSDLELFYNINDSDPEVIAKYALGYCDDINFKRTQKIDEKDLSDKLMKYERLKEWDSMYLFVLAIIDIYFNAKITRRNKLEVFVNWMIVKFRRSNVAFVFAVVLFSKCPIKKMMKFNPNLSSERKRLSVINMTWDFYIMSQFFKIWTSKNNTTEFLYASDDSAFCSLLRDCIQVQKVQNLTPIKHFMSKEDFENSQKLLDESMAVPNRAYDKKYWGQAYRSKLIQEFENKLFK